jgi:hypothetical protein
VCSSLLLDSWKKAEEPTLQLRTLANVVVVSRSRFNTAVAVILVSVLDVSLVLSMRSSRLMISPITTEHNAHL